MTGYILLALLVSCTFKLYAGLNIEQAKADLAQGGRNVCQYCSYCVYKGYCPCSYTECELCVYKYHCDSTCTGLCQTADPCRNKTCGVNSTCVESSPGKAECVCKVGHDCNEDQQCVDKGTTGQCDFYRCFDDRKKCGASGYPLRYGYKYCTRFDQYKDKFTTDGQTMITCVRKCLTNALLGHYHSNDQAGSSQTCDEIEKTAFNSHVQCYYNCDFCHVWGHNKLALHTVYEYSDFFSRQAIKQVTTVAAKCANTTYHDIKTWVSTAFTSVSNIIG